MMSNSAGMQILSWGGVTLVSLYVGYHVLGVAYAWGVMAAIDRIAIPILQHFFGYAGLGAVMPVFQYYAAWGVRVIAGALAGALYLVVIRLLKALTQAVIRWARGSVQVPLPAGHSDEENLGFI